MGLLWRSGDVSSGVRDLCTECVNYDERAWDRNISPGVWRFATAAPGCVIYSREAWWGGFREPDLKVCSPHNIIFHSPSPKSLPFIRHDLSHTPPFAAETSQYFRFTPFYAISTTAHPRREVTLSMLLPPSAGKVISRTTDKTLPSSPL